jgi:hypothetical protein
MTNQHNPNCAIVRMGDIRAWCDCKREEEQMNDNNKMPRWTAKITYMHDDGPHDRLFTFDELYELQDIVECGPDFYAIESIVVLINTDANHPKVTVEGALRR